MDSRAGFTVRFFSPRKGLAGQASLVSLLMVSGSLETSGTWGGDFSIEAASLFQQKERAAVMLGDVRLPELAKQTYRALSRRPFLSPVTRAEKRVAVMLALSAVFCG